MQPFDTSRQRYLDTIHRYLQGRLRYGAFRMLVPDQWSDERAEIWRGIWHATRAQRCLEREPLAAGEAPISPASDPRRFARMMDSVCNYCFLPPKEDLFRYVLKQLITVYREPGCDSPEGRVVDYPPRVNVFARPLPSGSRHRYPCTVANLRAQLARVPEYDLEGLWAIGLSPTNHKTSNAYGTYYRRKWPIGKPVILLHSVQEGGEFKLRANTDPGTLEQSFRVEHRYGIETERHGSHVVCRWSPENGRRYIVEHVLLHEIGHHVQYQQRRLARQYRRLPSHVAEQFAEDYAIRFHRELKE